MTSATVQDLIDFDSFFKGGSSRYEESGHIRQRVVKPCKYVHSQASDALLLRVTVIAFGGCARTVEFIANDRPTLVHQAE